MPSPHCTLRNDVPECVLEPPSVGAIGVFHRPSSRPPPATASERSPSIDPLDRGHPRSHLSPRGRMVDHGAARGVIPGVLGSRRGAAVPSPRGRAVEVVVVARAAAYPHGPVFRFVVVSLSRVRSPTPPFSNSLPVFNPPPLFALTTLFPADSCGPSCREASPRRPTATPCEGLLLASLTLLHVASEASTLLRGSKSVFRAPLHPPPHHTTLTQNRNRRNRNRRKETPTKGREEKRRRRASGAGGGHQSEESQRKFTHIVRHRRATSKLVRGPRSPCGRCRPQRKDGASRPP